MKIRVLIFIVSYNAEHFIESVLARIPDEIWNSEDFYTEVLIIDDQSSDNTYHRAHNYRSLYKKTNLTILYNPVNQGYGGNQKIGYHYAIENAFDVVVLVHGDGQYAPEWIGQMIEPILNHEADAVFGSRMIRKVDALKGKMPLYKWLGNQVLTSIQNCVLGADLSEFHSGYRAYSVSALASLPFMYNSDYFDFDTDIIIQLRKYSLRTIEADVDEYDFNSDATKVDFIFALDVIEHLKTPEAFLRKLRQRYSQEAPSLVITTGNIAFITVRLGLLLGLFNYGKRGILDLDHRRLFTFSSLRRTLTMNGYVVLEERGIPVPFPTAFGDGRIARLLLWTNALLIRLSKTLFSYQIGLVAKPKPTLNHLLQDARGAAEERLMSA
jgi:glycosyltransferase involved in cell wall biosynthesis